jgi:UDP-glucose:(heptosyl)LPS alpha-1,3-glucosyltransferase
MDIALCYENVLPHRGGCETYIASLTRRLCREGHSVHLYASKWDPTSLPNEVRIHPIEPEPGPRHLRPWKFSEACVKALQHFSHDVSVGFSKTWGQDVLYPQGGLHAASADHNKLKYQNLFHRTIAKVGKLFDPAIRSFAQLERKQYLGDNPPIIVAISRMVQRHFEQYYQIPASKIHVVHAAIDPERFHSEDRFRRRVDQRLTWDVDTDEPVGLFVGMNYRLKGLEPLIHALAYLPASNRFRLAVVGHANDGAYQRLARRLGVDHRVRFMGFCRDPKNPFFGADFLVHPTFYDPCSLVVLEALACGMPVITTRYNGASELLQPEEAGIVLNDPHDHRALAGSIERLCDSRTRSICSQAARQAGESWTFQHHYRALLNVFASSGGRRIAA